MTVNLKTCNVKRYWMRMAITMSGVLIAGVVLCRDSAQSQPPDEGRTVTTAAKCVAANCEVSEADCATYGTECEDGLDWRTANGAEAAKACSVAEFPNFTCELNTADETAPCVIEYECFWVNNMCEANWVNPILHNGNPDCVTFEVPGP